MAARKRLVAWLLKPLLILVLCVVCSLKLNHPAMDNTSMHCSDSGQLQLLSSWGKRFHTLSLA